MAEQSQITLSGLPINGDTIDANDGQADAIQQIVDEFNKDVGTSKLADDSVTAAKIEPQQDWVAPTLLNSWANYGSANYANAGYMKDSLGFVHLRGSVKSGSLGYAIFTLPTGYKTNSKLTFAVHSNNTIGICTIDTDGSVYPSGSNAIFSLDGITFKAEA